MVRPVCGRTITRIITGRLYLTLMDTTSRRSATDQADVALAGERYEPTEDVDSEARTFECSTCAYGETGVVKFR
jgi:hypothetical protein